MIQNLRVFERKPLSTEVIFEDEFGEELFFLYSKDISMGGLFLASKLPARVGTMFFLSFKVPPDKEPVRVTGEAIRIKDGMGIRFVGLSAVAKEKLLRFLSL